MTSPLSFNINSDEILKRTHIEEGWKEELTTCLYKDTALVKSMERVLSEIRHSGNSFISSFYHSCSHPFFINPFNTSLTPMYQNTILSVMELFRRVKKDLISSSQSMNQKGRCGFKVWRWTNPRNSALMALVFARTTLAVRTWNNSFWAVEIIRGCNTTPCCEFCYRIWGECISFIPGR